VFGKDHPLAGRYRSTVADVARDREFSRACRRRIADGIGEMARLATNLSARLEIYA
jgi:hypothetical protein